jgi:hypothetical protein
LRVKNNSGVTSEFNIEFEDVFADGPKAGASKISKYISVDNNKFILGHGEEAILTVTAKIPSDNRDKFVGGAILVTRRDPAEKVSGTSRVLTRLGTLVFVDIGKIATRSGSLVGFNYSGGNVFTINFKNTGEAKLNPYGVIEFRNIYGGLTEIKEIEPWFVLPATEKSIEVKWDTLSKFSPLYSAHLVLYPGYGDAENTANESVRVYNFYAIFSYIFLPVFLIIIFKKKSKHAKK